MHVQSKKYGNLVFISRLTAWYIMRNTKIKKRLRSSSQWTYLHHNGHVNKPKLNTDFLMILA